MIFSSVALATLTAFAPAPASATGFTVSPAVIAAEIFGQDPVLVDWRILGGLDLNTGKAPASLEALNGKVVKIAAFIVPLEDNMQESDEFLLVPYFGACVHTPPPPPNQMAFVKMVGRKNVKLALFDAIWLEGTLRITNYDSPYGQVGFQIDATNMTPYTGR